MILRLTFLLLEMLFNEIKYIIVIDFLQTFCNFKIDAETFVFADVHLVLFVSFNHIINFCYKKTCSRESWYKIFKLSVIKVLKNQYWWSLPNFG